MSSGDWLSDWKRSQEKAGGSATAQRYASLSARHTGLLALQAQAGNRAVTALVSAQRKQLAGNAAVAALVSPLARPGSSASDASMLSAAKADTGGVSVQRIELTKTDEVQIKTLKKTAAKVAKQAKKRIRAFDAAEGARWRWLTDFPLSSKIPADQRDRFLSDLYQKLGTNASFEELENLRLALDAEWDGRLLPTKEALGDIRRPPQPSAPGPESRPIPNLADLLAAKERLRSSPGQTFVPLVTGPGRSTGGGTAGRLRPAPPMSDRTPVPGGGTQVTPRQVTPAREALPPLPFKKPAPRSLETPSATTAKQGPSRAVVGPGPRPGGTPVARSWSDFPQGLQRELLGMWAAWERREVDASSFYDNLYKRSSLKATVSSPSADQYVDSLKSQGLLGSTSESAAANSSTGYPIDKPHKGGGGMPRGRLYLNPHPQHIVDVYRFVSERIYPLPGVMWVKLADHAVAMTARDVIVVYVSPAPEHAGTEQDAVALLRDYQQTHRGHFLDEVPRLTERCLPGVGLGAEPPTPDALGTLAGQQWEAMSFEQREEAWISVGQYSFSTYRSNLIVRAIQDAGGVGGSVEKFKALVAEYFARAGIDVRDPARQGAPEPSIVDLLGLIRKVET